MREEGHLLVSLMMLVLLPLLIDLNLPLLAFDTDREGFENMFDVGQ